MNKKQRKLEVILNHVKEINKIVLPKKEDNDKNSEEENNEEKETENKVAENADNEEEQEESG